ncbi:MAG: hypothetical protein KC501_23005 [Myxococcales bacterium]|nr:hypothetical protein [Myxococcales bacterium]
MSRLLPLLAPFAFSLAVTPAALASSPGDVCVRQAKAVPGAQNKFPEWWNPSLSESQREVRWTGATTRTEGDSAAPPLASSRMIWDKPSRRVFFEFEIAADPSIDSDEDVVVLAVSNSAGSQPELFIQFQPLRGCSPVTNCDEGGAALGGASVHYSAATGGGSSITWSPLSTTNPSTDFVVQQPWVQVRENVSGGSTTYDWKLKLALEVPIASGSGEIRPDLKVYGNAMMFMPGTTSGTVVQFPLLCNPDGLTGNNCLITSGAGGSMPSDLPLGTNLSIWPTLDSADPNGCGGVRLVRELVGSDYNTHSGTIPGTSIPYNLPGSQIPYYDGARFRAGFHNDTDIAIGAGDISAEFRIANWGLQYSTWKDATWSLVATADLSSTVTANGWAGTFGQGSLTSDPWVPATSGLALENSHQCVHVKLKANTAIPIAVDSVYRNMDLVGASVVQRPSEIDMRGHKLPKGQSAHQVYLLVRSEHMPTADACRSSKGKIYGCAKGGKLVAEQKGLSKGQKAALRKDFDKGAVKMSKADLDALMSLKPKKGKKPNELPFYAVYGMVDTGLKVNLPKAPHTVILDPFSAYGYYVEHEGQPPEGWEHYIHGVDEVDTKNHSLFKLEVKPNKVASVANTVRVLSKETKKCTTPPKSNWAVYSAKKTRELENRIKTEVGKGKAAEIRTMKIADDQLGCDPPPLRLQCDPKTCPPPSPAANIEHSRYVGDFTIVAKPAARPSRMGTRRPAGRRPVGNKTRGKTPTARPKTK